MIIALTVFGKEYSGPVSDVEDAIEADVKQWRDAVTPVALARMVIETLEAQQRYFRSRSREDLIASKQLEVKLLRTCEAVIDAGTPAVTLPVENTTMSIACTMCGGQGRLRIRQEPLGRDKRCARCHGTGYEPS
jgi:hypothetical protein